MRAYAGVVLVAMGFFTGCEEKAAPPARTAVDENTNEPVAMTVSAERSDAIEHVFARKAAELQSCWADEYERNHNRKLEGDLTVGMTITPAGKPEAVKILKTSLGNQEIETCVVRTVSGWTFPDGQAPVPYMRTVHLGAQF